MSGAVKAEEPEQPVDYIKQQLELLETLVYDRKNADAWLALGNNYFDQDMPEKSIRAYTSYLELKPDDCNALVDRGIMYRHSGHLDKAIIDFNSCLRISQDNLNALHNLAIVYAIDLNDPVRARTYLPALRKVAPPQIIKGLEEYLERASQ
jgi:tetratricopeptide (TPR) repeat protein